MLDPAQIEQAKTTNLIIMPNGHYSPWTPDRVATLTQRWADGVSAAKLADELGVSRNAVIGKIGRLKLPQRETKIGYANVGNRTPRERKERHLRVSKKNGAKPVLVDEIFFYPPPGIEDLAIPTEQRKFIHQLNNHTCRWPVGNPGDLDFFYCGAEPLKDHPYCTDHCRRAFRAKVDRHSGKYFLPKWADWPIDLVPTASP